jgi:3-dehydroquinate dehydratase-2
MSKKASILVIQGPNLNLLGTREPGVYGTTTLKEIHQKLEDQAQAQSVDLSTYQSNHEGELIDRIQKAKQDGGTFQKFANIRG